MPTPDPHATSRDDLLARAVGEIPPLSQQSVPPTYPLYWPPVPTATERSYVPLSVREAKLCRAGLLLALPLHDDPDEIEVLLDRLAEVTPLNPPDAAAATSREGTAAPPDGAATGAPGFHSSAR